MKPKVLVTAANGHTGFHAARELLSLGFPVRAFVRNPGSSAARELEQLGAELVVGDIEDIRDARRSLEGVKRAYFVPAYPNVLFQGATFATAAEQMKLEHVVVLTQWLSSNSHPSVYTKEHWLTDQTFKRLQVAKAIFINPGLFAFPYFLLPAPIVHFGMLPDFGSNAPPSNEDIGAVAAHILAAPTSHEGQTYRITGRDLLTAQEIADVVGEVLGRRVRAVEMPEKMLLKALRAERLPIADVSQLRYYVQDARDGAFAFNAPTSVVKDIVGRDAEDFATIARRYLKGNPALQPTLANKLRAVASMLGVALTPAWNMKKFEQEQRFPSFENMLRSTASEEWRLEHSI